MGRVDAAYVKLRIGLQIAQPFGFGEDILIGFPGVFHPGQDVVARPVHHPHHAGDLIPGEAFDQRLDYRDAACHGSFIADGRPFGLGQFGQCLTVDGQKRLVRGDHLFARTEGRFGCLLGRTFGAAHEFHENVYVIALCQSDGIVFPAVARQGYAAVLVAGPGGDR